MEKIGSFCLYRKERGTILNNHLIPIIIAGLVCLVLIAGCISSPAGTPAGTPAVTPAGTAGAKDTSAIIPQFDAYAEKTFTKSGVPGMAVVIVKDDRVDVPAVLWQ